MSGIGGGVSAVYRTIDVEIGSERFPAKVTGAIEEDIPLILGRMDIFGLFDIEFSLNRKTTIFKKIE